MKDMDKPLAAAGNGISWLAVLAAWATQMAPIVQVAAALLAGAASLATLLYFIQRIKHIREERRTSRSCFNGFSRYLI